MRATRIVAQRCSSRGLYPRRRDKRVLSVLATVREAPCFVSFDLELETIATAFSATKRRYVVVVS